MKRSIIQCPQCGFKVTEKITKATQQQREYYCPACEKTSTIALESCCIFCEWGSQPCVEKKA